MIFHIYLILQAEVEKSNAEYQTFLDEVSLFISQMENFHAEKKDNDGGQAHHHAAAGHQQQLQQQPVHRADQDALVHHNIKSQINQEIINAPTSQFHLLLGVLTSYVPYICIFLTFLCIYIQNPRNNYFPTLSTPKVCRPDIQSLAEAASMARAGQACSLTRYPLFLPVPSLQQLPFPPQPLLPHTQPLHVLHSPPIQLPEMTSILILLEPPEVKHRLRDLHPPVDHPRLLPIVPLRRLHHGHGLPRDHGPGPPLPSPRQQLRPGRHNDPHRPVSWDPRPGPRVLPPGL